MLVSILAPSLLAVGNLVQASPLLVRRHDAPVSHHHSGEEDIVTGWAADTTSSFPIHESCNSTLRAQLEVALHETVLLAQHARDHLLRFGNDSALVRKYFGTGPTAVPIGWYQRVMSADRGTMLFRCDDPDRNCATQSGWAGHWRGANATQDTVICPRSFELRRHLDAVCGLGYTVATSPLNTYWAVGLLHRIFHVPRISEGVVAHYATDYKDVVALAQAEPQKSAIDSDTLQYFAIDAWAFDIAVPGVGC